MKGLVAIALTQAADLLTFVWCLSFIGIQNELNPIVRAVYATAGLSGVVLFKTLGASLSLLALWMSGRFISHLLIYRIMVLTTVFVGFGATLANLLAAWTTLGL